jgi:hypothetical protein
MPIRDVTERPQIPRLGKIRLGYKDPAKNGAPVNTPYFVVPPEVAEVYGEKPTELSIVFLSDDTERIASQWYRAYNATNGLFCKGDGETADALLDGDALRKLGGELPEVLPVDVWAHGATGGRKATAEIVRHRIGCLGKGYDGIPACPMYEKKGCKQTTFLQFAIRDVPGLGVYQLDTSSMVSTRKIMGAIEMARMMLGSVAGVPMKLERVEVEVAPDGKKKKVWMVDLKVDTTYSLSRLLELRQGPVAAALLPPVDESGPELDDDEVIDGEVVQVGEMRTVDSAEEPAQEPSDAETLQAPAPPPPVAPVDLLNEIKDKYGVMASGDARACMPWLYGTGDLLKLTDAQRQDYAAKLRVRLQEPQHAHVPKYTGETPPRLHCERCGAEIDESAVQEGQPALT